MFSLSLHVAFQVPTFVEAEHLHMRTVRAIRIPCGESGIFQCECYHEANPETPKVWFLLRWLVDYLGGNAAKNFIGLSVDTWRGKIDHYETCDVEPEPNHILDSSWKDSMKRVKSAHAEEPADEVARPITDFAVTSFGFVILVCLWSVHGYRSNSSWSLDIDSFKKLARNLLIGVVSTFGQSLDAEIDGVRIVVEDGWLIARHLRASSDTKCLEKCIPEAKYPVHDALLRLQLDESKRSLSQNRRDAAKRVFSAIVRCMADAVDSSILKPEGTLWTEDLSKLDDLRSRFFFLPSAPL